jgi:glycosyltransferase involved in cell wall biosynthesis
MHILFFTDTFFPLVGGAEMVLHNLALRLQDAGEKVTVLAPRVKGMDPEQDRAYSYRVVRYRTPRSKRFFQRRMLWDLLRIHWEGPVDMLHCHAGYPQAFVGASFKLLTGVPMVVRPHGSDVVPGGRIRRNKRLERRLIKGLARADAVVAQGQYLRAVIGELGVEQEKIHVINNGVDLSAFSQWEPYPHSGPYLLALGSLIRRKGFDLLIQAYARLDSPPWDLLIAGTGPEEQALLQLAEEQGVADRVRFVGFVAGREKVDLMRSAQCLVSASRKEPFSNVILEAYAAGLPVAASAIDGNLELVRHGETGYHFESGSVDSLVQVLERMIAAPEQMRLMRENVKRFVSSYDWLLVADRYRALYLELLQSR